MRVLSPAENLLHPWLIVVAAVVSVAFWVINPKATFRCSRLIHLCLKQLHIRLYHPRPSQQQPSHGLTTDTGNHHLCCNSLDTRVLLSKYKADPAASLLKTPWALMFDPPLVSDAAAPFLITADNLLLHRLSPGCMLCLGYSFSMYLTWLCVCILICISSPGWWELRLLPLTHCSARKLSVTQLQYSVKCILKNLF